MGCILQLAMMIYGIVVVVKGEFSVTRKRVIIGTTARVLGAILIAYLPLALMTGIVFGVFLVVSNPALANNPVEMTKVLGQFWWIDVGLFVLTIFLLVVIAFSAKKYDRSQVVNGKLINTQPIEDPFKASYVTRPYTPDSGNPFQPPR